MIFEKVRSILAEQLDIDEDSITLDSAIIDDLGADSLDIVDLVCGEQADDAVSIANGGNLGYGNDDSAPCACDGVHKALLDPCGTVDEDVVELFFQIGDYLLHLLGCDSHFIARLRGRKQEKTVIALIPDESLLQTAGSFDDIYKVEYDPVFQTENNIEVSEADICIHKRDALTEERKPCADISGRGGFADAAFS